MVFLDSFLIYDKKYARDSLCNRFNKYVKINIFCKSYCSFKWNTLLISKRKIKSVIAFIPQYEPVKANVAQIKQLTCPTPGAGKLLTSFNIQDGIRKFPSG